MNVKCQYCKNPVETQLPHPNTGRDGGSSGLEHYWMTYCKKCDIWSVIPMLELVK